MDIALRTYLDQVAIRHLLAVKERATDRLDDELSRSAFSPSVQYRRVRDVRENHEGFLNYIHTEAPKRTALMHYQFPMPVDIQGDEAWCEAYYLGAVSLRTGEQHGFARLSNIQTEATNRDDLALQGGRCLYRIRRAGEQWKIESVTRLMEWHALLDGSTLSEILPLRTRRSRDHSDASYEYLTDQIPGPRSLGDLLDHELIHDLLVRYAHAMDRRDGPSLASMFVPDAHVRLGSSTRSAEEFIREQSETGSPWQTQHLLSIPVIQVSANDAVSETAVFAVERSDDAGFGAEGLRFLDRYERRNGAWEITFHEVIPEWRAHGASVQSFEASDRPDGSRERRLLDPSASVDASSKWIRDRASISRCIQRTARGMDRLDDELLGSTGLGAIAGLSAELREQADRFCTSSTYLFNTEIDLDDTEARCVVSALSVGSRHNEDPPAVELQGELYVVGLRRQGDDWVIRTWQREPLWRMTADASLAIPFISASAIPTTRDSTDPSYDRDSW